jgi:hypothetical protein
MKNRTWKQVAQDRNKESGRFSKGPQCYACNRPAGHDYCSHPMSDCDDPDGQNWGDMALVLCKDCEIATHSMTRVQEFLDYQKAFWQ